MARLIVEPPPWSARRMATGERFACPAGLFPHTEALTVRGTIAGRRVAARVPTA